MLFRKKIPSHTLGHAQPARLKARTAQPKRVLAKCDQRANGKVTLVLPSDGGQIPSYPSTVARIQVKSWYSKLILFAVMALGLLQASTSEAINASRRRFFKQIAGLTALAVYPRVAHALNQTGEASKLSQDIAKVGFKLHHLLTTAHPAQNLALSPQTLMTALGMAYAGAAGATAKAMEQVLGFNQGTHEDFQNLMGDVDQSVKISSANAAFARPSDADARRIFNATLQRYYEANLPPINFDDPVAATRAINTWGSQRTSGKIPELLPIGAITEQTQIALTSAMHFNGKWLHVFPAKNTKDRPFTLLSGQAVDKPTMSQPGTFELVRGFGDVKLDAALLPYEGDRHALLVVKPSMKQGGIAALEQSLANDHTYLSEILAAMNSQPATLQMPKLSLTSGLKLKEALSAIGLGRLFSEQADFSSMGLAPNLGVDEVYQTNTFALDEERTEATSATAVIMATRSLQLKQPELPVLAMNSPFMWFLIDTQAILLRMHGRVVTP